MSIEAGSPARLLLATMGLAVVASVAVLGGAFAYFTDYESKDLSARAGTLTMNITEATEDLSNGLTIIKRRCYMM